MASSSRVSLDDCFPLDDFPAQGGDVVGWGPHNVLHVSTRWSVSLYQANAQHAAARISAQRHPLASGASLMETGSFISGAKWSPSLVPERIYPPTARLAISIGGHVLIYRVARQGNGRVSVSHGIGLQVAPRASPSLSASPSCEDESPKKRQRRGASERSDSSSEDSEEPPTRRHRRASRQAATNNLEKRGASLIDYVWWSDDVLIIITNMGLHLVDMKNRDEDDSEPHTVQLPPPAYRFDADGAPVPTCASCAIAIAASQPSFLMCAGMGSLRLFRISTGEGVRLIQSMEVPSLTALPTSLCATPMYTPQPTSETDSNCSETGWNVFVAMPLCVVRGCIMTTATSPQRSLSRKPTSPPIGCRWTVSAVYSAGMLPVDPFLRRFVVVPLHQNQPLRKETAKTLPSRETHAVLGYSRRALFVFFMDERPPKCLLSCPTLVEKFDVKDSAVVALGGLSVHPSSTLAAMVVQSGVPRLPPVHLHLVSADDHDSFLRVVLDGGWTTLAQNSNESLLEQTWMRLGELHPYAWETILPESHGTCFALRQYSSAWQRFVSRTQASAMADASTSPASSSVDVAQHSMAMELQSYRENYNQLREQYGVDVFLRHVVEDDFQELHSIPSGPAARWWHFLLAVWRRCPWDRSVLMELLLGNAVLVLARVSGYANFHMGPHDAAWAEGEGCATTSTMLCSSAAAAFIRLYLQCAENNDSVKPSERQSMWAPTPAWIASLSGFLNSTALCTEQVSRMVYPCSVCDKRDASALTLTLSHTSSHPLPVSGPSAVDETHTTAFSPKTFAPLSLFSTESVLVMCLSCGMSDFAVGPHCRLCGGVLK